MLARDVHIEQTAVANVVANHVTFDRQSFAGVVIARQRRGQRPDTARLARAPWRWPASLGAVSAVMAVVRRR